MKITGKLQSNTDSAYYDAIGKLGYTKQQAERRVKVYRHIAENSTLFCRRTTRGDIDVIVAGSRGEGVGIWNDSDADVLFVQRNIKCLDIYRSSRRQTDAHVVFLLDFMNVEFGYAMLRLISKDNTAISDKKLLLNIQSNLVQRNGNQYLRNDQIFTTAAGYHRYGVTKQQFVFADTTGPAKTVICELPFSKQIAIDRVLAFPCSCPSLLYTWCRRQRSYAWPEKNLIERVNNMSVFVVPVGINGSVDEVLQWRLSVTLAEQALVHSFNDAQIKLYVAIKMLMKQELNPVCSSISSYIVKNVVFWMYEETAYEQFTREKFENCFIQLLQRFKRHVFWRYLPHYMFPSRNLLKYKILERERAELLHCLDVIIKDGVVALRRCPLINEAICLPVEIFQIKITFFELIEQVIISVLCIPLQNFNEFMEKRIIRKSFFHLREEEIIYIVLKYGFPLIRRFNPYGYFNHISVMSDEEIVNRLWEGAFLYLKGIGTPRTEKYK